MYTIINCATSLDSRLEGKFSNEKDWERVYKLRSSFDAIMVGINTVLKDDPRLSSHGKGKDPLIVVVDSACRIPVDARILCGKSVIAVSESAPKNKIKNISSKAKVIVCGKKKVDLKHLIDELSAMGIKNLIVEGGGTLISSMLDSGLVDEINVAIAPKITGIGVKFVEKELKSAISLELKGTERLDDVVVLKYRIIK